MKVIGLTGGIASGKSTVALILRELGAAVIDADQVAREVVLPGQKAYIEIVKRFGTEILDSDGAINRSKLGAIIFKNTDARKLLNEITHPRIYYEIIKQIEEIRKKNPEKIIVIDVALLIETGMTEIADEIWLTVLPEKRQVARLMERNGLKEEEAKKRINSQMTSDEKRKFAHRIIDTSGLLQDTRKQVIFFFNKIMNHES